MPAITRKGDADVTHCSTPFREGASENVFVNNIGVSRQGDLRWADLQFCGAEC